MYITYDRVIAKKAKLIREVQRMSFESAEYARNHPQEVAEALAKKHKRPVKLFRDWMSWNTITGELKDIDLKTLDTLLGLSKQAGLLESYPPVESMVYRGYWRR